MRIGYLTYGLDRAPTGIGRYAKELLLAILADTHGHEITILSTEQTLDPDLANHCAVRNLPGCRTLPALMSAGNLLIGRAAHDLKLDMIHDPNGIAPFLALPRRTGRVVTLHDAFPFVQPESHNRLDNWRYRWFLPIALRRTDSVITVSNTSKEDLTRDLNLDDIDVAVIPEGVGRQFTGRGLGTDDQTLRQRYGISSPYVLYVGALNGRKNIARMLQAFRLAYRDHPEYALVIAGKRQWKAEAIDHVMEDPVLQRVVKFTGYVPDEDLPGIYRGATAFLFPSLYEGFGLPVLEAMACGTPVITSNISSMPEVAGNAAILVDPYDVSEMSAAIGHVLGDPALHEALTNAGINRASAFNWDATAQQTMAHYERVAATRARCESTVIQHQDRKSVNAD